MLLVIGNILTSQLTCYDAIHLSLVKKKGGGFETHVTFSMELFVTIVHSFWVVLLSKRATWLMGQGSWTHFLKNILFRLKLSHKWKMITVYISKNIKGMQNKNKLLSITEWNGILMEYYFYKNHIQLAALKKRIQWTCFLFTRYF